MPIGGLSFLVMTIAFGERRLTDGLKVPYRITTTSHGKIIDDLLLERVDINPKLTKADFERDHCSLLIDDC